MSSSRRRALLIAPLPEARLCASIGAVGAASRSRTATEYLASASATEFRIPCLIDGIRKKAN